MVKQTSSTPKKGATACKPAGAQRGGVKTTARAIGARRVPPQTVSFGRYVQTSCRRTSTKISVGAQHLVEVVLQEACARLYETACALAQDERATTCVRERHVDAASSLLHIRDTAMSAAVEGYDESYDEIEYNEEGGEACEVEVL